ncbi:hypothetical protein WSM22_30540 [Cytophagales bacterium WSM2-2]|nr:hypothetical protein WSM22_30540 [Cytophagales bacterium WSM2-2]
MRLIYLLLLFITTGLFSCGGDGSAINRETTKENRIIDNADLLTTEQEDSVFYLIDQLDKEIGSQIVVLTIDSLNGQDINEFSNHEFESRRLGRDKELDGLLMTIAVKDKSMRIEVGYGLERIIKDEIASRINRNVIAPKFREGKFGQGIYNGVDTIKTLIEKNKDLVGKMLR